MKDQVGDEGSGLFPQLLAQELQRGHGEGTARPQNDHLGWSGDISASATPWGHPYPSAGSASRAPGASPWPRCPPAKGRDKSIPVSPRQCGAATVSPQCHPSLDEAGVCGVGRRGPQIPAAGGVGVPVWGTGDCHRPGCSRDCHRPGCPQPWGQAPAFLSPSRWDRCGDTDVQGTAVWKSLLLHIFTLTQNPFFWEVWLV